MGETADALAWIMASLPQPAEVEVIDLGPWHPRGGSLFATDAVTLQQTDDALDLLHVPDAPAQVVGVMAVPQGHAAALALIWSDAPVDCATQITEIYTATGLVAFLAPADMDALEQQAADLFYDPTHTSHAAQLAANVPTRPHLTRLDDGTRFPVTGAPVTAVLPSVTTLMDAQGGVVALYADFMGENNAPQPAPCPASGS